MAGAGLDDILIANQVIGAQKLRRLAELAQRVRLAILVDSREGVALLDEAFREAGVGIDVLIEVDTGKGRCGLTDLEEIAAIAQQVVETDRLVLRGVETHEGHVPSGAHSAGEMEERATSAGQRLVEVADALRDRGHIIEEVSVGSTPAAPYTATAPGVTEMRPGTYVFNDVNQMSIGQASPEDCALSVLATVISRPADDRAVLDAGSKSLFAEPARKAFAFNDYAGFGYVRQAPSARIVSLSEEHGVVHLPPGTEFPAIGQPVEIIPNHVCPAVNLHEELYLVDGEDVVEVWPIAARGRVR
jgi:D-serine deaminase-like pyridoxal phosphate-dependent protein